MACEMAYPTEFPSKQLQRITATVMAGTIALHARQMAIDLWWFLGWCLGQLRQILSVQFPQQERA